MSNQQIFVTALQAVLERAASEVVEASELATSTALATLLSHAALDDEAPANGPLLLRKLCSAEDSGQSWLVEKIVAAVELRRRASDIPDERDVSLLILFRFGRVPESDVLPAARVILSSYDMQTVRFAFTQHSKMQADKGIKAIRQLADETIAGAELSKKSPLHFYNLLLLADLLNPDLVDALCDAMATGDVVRQADESRPGVAASLQTIVDRLMETRRLAAPAAVKRIDRPINVAVCISGQLRGYRTAFETWSHFGLEPDRRHYYLHSWQQVGRKYPTLEHCGRSFSGRFLDAFRQAAAIHGVASLEKIYPQFFRELAGSDTASEDEVREFYGAEAVVLEDQNRQPFSSYSNSEKMHYKMWASHGLALNSRRDFDLYVRIRPDKLFSNSRELDWGRILHISETKNVVVTNMRPTVFMGGSLGVSDEFAIGAASVMNSFVGAWVEAPKTWAAGEYTGFKPRFDGHETLFWNGLRHGVRTQTVQSIATAQFPGPTFGPQADPAVFPPDFILEMLERDVAARAPHELDQVFLAALR